MRSPHAICIEKLQLLFKEKFSNFEVDKLFFRCFFDILFYNILRKACKTI